MGCCCVSADKVTTSETNFYCCGVVDTNLELEQSGPGHSSPAGNNNSCAFEKRHGMAWCSNANLGIMPVDEALEANENANNVAVTKVTDPVIPFEEDIPERLYVGRAIVIKGVVNDKADRFSINLKISEKDTLFHFNPRFDRRVVVRNYKRSGQWGEEEIAVSRFFPFEPGTPTLITVFMFDSQVMVSVDQEHFCGFDIRSQLHLVRRLRIDGDITLSSIIYHDAVRYPDTLITHLPAIILPKLRPVSDQPIVKRDKESLMPGSAVVIKGRVKLLPQNFYINLQVGSSIVPHPIIPFHMNLRLCQRGQNEHQMVYNSWQKGRWEEELRSDHCPFLPGLPFTVRILYLTEGFHVSVNDEFVIAFPLRFAQPPEIDTLRIDGDCFITEVDITPHSLSSVVD